MQAYLLIAPLLLGVAMAGYDPYFDLARLYRMQLLDNAFNSYSPDNLQMDGPPVAVEEPSYWPEMSELDEDVGGQGEMENNAIYNDPFYGGAHIRDQEHLQHSTLNSYQPAAGGALSEEPAATKQSKNDKALPAYCNPPNPCPLGVTADKDCVENFENSATNNKKLLSEQECPCDTEHMFSCPAGRATVSSKGQSGSQRMALNKVIDQLSKAENNVDEMMAGDSILSPTRKRLHLVAKKSPHIIHKRSAEFAHNNPYFKGPRMAIAAKKNHKSAQNSMGWYLADVLDTQ